MLWRNIFVMHMYVRTFVWFKIVLHLFDAPGVFRGIVSSSAGPPVFCLGNTVHLHNFLMHIDRFGTFLFSFFSRLCRRFVVESMLDCHVLEE